MKSDIKKQKLDTYQDNLRLNHFHTDEERKMLQNNMKVEAENQLKLKQEIRAREKAQIQREERQMLNHLRMQQKKEVEALQAKRARLTKIAQENRDTAIYRQNFTQKEPGK